MSDHKGTMTKIHIKEWLEEKKKSMHVANFIQFLS